MLAVAVSESKNSLQDRHCGSDLSKLDRRHIPPDYERVKFTRAQHGKELRARQLKCFASAVDRGAANDFFGRRSPAAVKTSLSRDSNLAFVSSQQSEIVGPSARRFFRSITMERRWRSVFSNAKYLSIRRSRDRVEGSGREEPSCSIVLTMARASVSRFGREDELCTLRACMPLGGSYS